MILTPNFDRVPDEALEKTLRRLLDREPFGLHSVVDCWNPECSSCNRWKAWAREVREVNNLIDQRNNKKA